MMALKVVAGECVEVGVAVWVVLVLPCDVFKSVGQAFKRWEFRRAGTHPPMQVCRNGRL